MGRTLPMSRIAAAWLAALLFAALAAPAAAILPAAAPTPAQDSAEPAIETESAAGSDERIAERIRGIFSELPRLAGLSVDVREGVVMLSGTVAEAEDRARAEAIAARVAGVVTVENAIERDTSVGGGIAGIQDISRQFAGLLTMLPLIGTALLVALVIGAAGYLIAGLGRLWNRLAPNPFLAELIASAIRFVFVLGGIVVGLDMLGAGSLMGAVLGGAGVIGIALGFAMRETIENYVASLMLSLRQPFRANDHVVIDSHEGRVIRLTSRATILMTLDGNHLRIPNSAVFKAVILNYTRNPQRRFDFQLGIDADDDPTAARNLGVEVLKSLDFVVAEPEPMAVVEDVGDSNIVIRFFGWVDQSKTDFGKARSRAIPAVKDALENAGFALPEPIYRLRFDSPPPPQVVEPARTPAAEKPRREPAAADAGDVAPEEAVAKMVDEERSATPGDRDLLDPRRPVE
jgi:small-conductance mechanosensitive channel